MAGCGMAFRAGRPMTVMCRTGQPAARMGVLGCQSAGKPKAIVQVASDGLTNTLTGAVLVTSRLVDGGIGKAAAAGCVTDFTVFAAFAGLGDLSSLVTLAVLGAFDTAVGVTELGTVDVAGAASSAVRVYAGGRFHRDRRRAERAARV
ncbi:hypothetical protein PF010_g5336 [Phytophthora fragariae]|uniref:Uncharacterized protein n=1 Tax=Phytophthora fragariae TaxID=53985 RepID=A0A6G0LP91_9STRA|nr:hypothetical protein PF010_g5336 [Phytophthora fragariae]KAE9245379.1 hypothetical protein PF004_g5264 [Phytophthora fragariae]